MRLYTRSGFTARVRRIAAAPASAASAGGTPIRKAATTSEATIDPL